MTRQTAPVAAHAAPARPRPAVVGGSEPGKGVSVGLPRYLQSKLLLGSTSDPAEAAADQVANRVLAGAAAGAIDRTPTPVRRAPEVSAGEHGAVPASVERTLVGGGLPLETTLRREMEQRFGRDFSQVRVHRGEAAAQSARDVDALAYTVGNDIVFGAGGCQPATRSGQRLLAHELTHVVQQSPGVLRRDRVRPPADAPDPSEAIADAQSALLDSIQREFDRPAGGARARAKTREQTLVALFVGLEPSYATLVERAVTSGRLRERFEKLPQALRQRLSALLAGRKGTVPLLPPGVYGQGSGRTKDWDYFIVRLGVTIDEVAAYLSDEPTLAKLLEAHNNMPRDQLLAAGTLVYFPKRSMTRPTSLQRKFEDRGSGSFISSWGGQVVDHVGERTMNYNDIPLTRTEYDALLDNQHQQAPRRRKPVQSDAAKDRAEDFKRAQQVPNPLLSLFFPTSRLYVRDQAPLIHDALARFRYQTNLRGFDAGTNLARNSGAVAVAVNLLPLVVIEAPAALSVAAESGAGQAVLYGGRYVYLNAPVLYGDLALYSGAALTGVKLGQHLQKVRTSGFDLSDIPRLAEDLAPFFGGWSESNSYRANTGASPVAPATTISTPRFSFAGRWLRNSYLSLKMTIDDVVPEHANINAASGGGRAVPAQVQHATRATATARTTVNAADAPDAPVVPARAMKPASTPTSVANTTPTNAAPTNSPTTAPLAVSADDAAFAEDANYQTGTQQQVNRVRTTGSGRQLMSLDAVPLTAAQRSAARAVHGQRLAAAQQAAWQNATNHREQNEIAEVARLWNLGTVQAQQQARVLARAMFNRHRSRHWTAVRASPALRAAFESAGMRFRGGNTTAPVYELPDGTVVRMTIEHGRRLSDDPTRAVDATNLQYVLDDENSFFLEFLRAFDPFQ